MVRILLDDRAKVRIKGKRGVTALAAAKNVKTVDLLISHGATVEEAIPFWFGEDVMDSWPRRKCSSTQL